MRHLACCPESTSAAPGAPPATVTATLVLSCNPPESVTVNSKTSSSVGATMTGATKAGFIAVGSDSVTGGPAICLHAQDTVPPSGSVEPEPSRTTRLPGFTVRFGPAAWAVGGKLLDTTLTMQVSRERSPARSVTVSSKTRDSPSVSTSGATKVVCTAERFG